MKMATERNNTSRLFTTSVVEGKLDIDEVNIASIVLCGVGVVFT